MTTLSVFCKRAAALALALLLTGAILRTAVSAEEPDLSAAPAAETIVPEALTAAPEAVPEADPASLNFFATSYTVSAPGSQNGLGTLRRGDKADIAVVLKDTALTTDAFVLEDYDFSKLIDSFSACTPKAELISSGSEPVSVKVTCPGIEYSGTGQSLKLSAARKGSTDAPQTVEVTVSQAELYVKPDPTPTPAPKEVPAPMVLITRSAQPKPLAANETADIVVTFQNTGKTMVQTPVVSFSASEALTILNENSTFLLPDIEPGKSASVTVRVQAAKEIQSAGQSLQADLKFSYDNAGTLTQASTSEKLNLSASTTGDGQKTDAATPNVVIQDFSYGEQAISAGGHFKLDFRFQNMGRLKIENVVVTVDGGENFALDGGTSTFYYDSLASRGDQRQSVPLMALPTAKSGAQPVTVSFKYEYVDGGKRSASSSEIKLSVPVVQQDRFQISAPTLPESVTAGEEVVLTLNYVNRGKADVSNVEAVIEGSGFDSPTKNQYVGNITAGTSGSVGFALTPSNSGKLKVVLKVTYEDPNLEQQTKEFPVELTVAEMAEPDFDPELDGMAETGGTPFFPWPVLGVIPAAAVIAVLVVVIRKKRTAKADPAARADNADWDNWDTAFSDDGDDTEV